MIDELSKRLDDIKVVDACCYSLVALSLCRLHCESKKGTSILLPITLADVDGFSKFFHC